MGRHTTVKLVYGLELTEQQARQAHERFYNKDCDCLMLTADSTEEELDYPIKLVTDSYDPYADISAVYQPGYPHYLGLVLTEQSHQINPLRQQIEKDPQDFLAYFKLHATALLQHLGLQDSNPQLFICCHSH